MTTDPLSESLQRLQPMLDSFTTTLSHLCEANNKAHNVCALRKDLQDYYHNLHTDILSRYETLKQKEKQIHNSATQTLKLKEKEIHNSATQTLKRKEKEIPNSATQPEVTEEKSGAIAGYSPPTILPVEVDPELEYLCRETDGDGLRNSILKRNNRGAQAKLRLELPAALSKAPEAGKLVLNAIRGYNLSGSSSVLNERSEAQKCKMACILLLECLFPVFGSDESAFVPKDDKDKAREIAIVWRQKMGLDKVESANKLDIRAFLQLLTTFRIAKDYGQDELCELWVPIARQKESPALCLFLGLNSKMPDLLDKLSKTSKPFDCIRYAHAFGMMDKIKPADLLKLYLENVKRAARDNLKKGQQGPEASLKNSTNLEKIALNRVIRIVKEYDLQNVYSIDDLQNEVQRLEQDAAANRSLAAKRTSEDEKKAANASRGENTAAAPEAGKKRKAADSTKEENKAAAAKVGKQKKTANIKEDEKNADVEKTKQKRLQSSEPADSIVGIFGTKAPAERGLYRPSQRAKHVSKEDFNRVGGGRRNSPTRIDLLSRYQSSYHDAIRNTMRPSSDMIVNNEQNYYDSYPSTFHNSNINPMRPSSDMIVNNEQKYCDSYPTSHNSNINPIGVSLYGSSSMVGAFSYSSFNQSQINDDLRSLQSCVPSPMTSAYAVSSLNPPQLHSESRTLQSYTSALVPVDKHSFGSPRHGKSGLTNSSSSLVQNTSAFGGGNLLNTGSSAYGSGDSLLYNFDDSSVPSYITKSYVERRDPEQQKPSFANSNTSEYGLAASVGCQSAMSKYQFNGGLRFCTASDHNSSLR